jgi:pilus assembly protein CpaB
MLVQNHPAPVATVKLSKVVVAKADITPGQQLKAEDLAEGQVSPDAVPSGAFSDVQSLVGRVADAQMVKGQPVLEAQLAPQGAGAGLQALVPEGMRAITIEVNEFSGVAGLLTPGCHVDVLATIQSNNKQLTRAIVQDVKVTAVGQHLTAQDSQKQDPNQPPQITRSITVLVTLEQAEAIELATATGRPRLVLRSARDQTIARSAGVTLGELCGTHADNQPLAKATATTKPAPEIGDPFADSGATTRPAEQKYMVRVFRGGSESMVALDPPKAQEPAEASSQSGYKEATH